jgi:hypothetical protein
MALIRWTVLAVTLALPLAISGQPTLAMAQSAQAPAQATYQSSGLRATIINASMDRDSKINVQLAVHNETKNRQHLFWIGARRGSISSGEFFSLSDVVGIAYCSRHSSNDADNIKMCTDQYRDDVGFYSYIEPSEYMVASLRFNPPGGNVKFGQDIAFSFVVKFLARSASAETVAQSNTLAPPRIVTLNFPLVPVKKTGQ